MTKLKILFAGLILVSLLLTGQSAEVRADAAELSPGLPPVAFVQDKNEKMLVNHNFSNDSQIYVPADNYEDSGFYVNIPSEK